MEVLSTSGMEAARLEVLKMLYPIFKQEVFDRRQAVMKVTSLGAVFLTVLLLLVSSRLLQVGEGAMPRWLTIVGIVVFTGLLIHQIRQQQLRHALAKQGLIEIEKAFLFFEENAYLPGRSLYPPQWQAPPGKDRNVAISILSLLGLTAVVIAAILLA